MIQAPTPPPGPPFDPNLIWMSDGGPPAIVMIVLLSLLATTVILWPVMRALARRLEGKGNTDPALRAEVAELEERLDFAERLLTRGQEQSPAGPGNRS